jgi:hypothetical protein
MNWDELKNIIIEQGGYIPCFHPKAFDELSEIFHRNQSVGKTVAAALIKLSRNPLPNDMGGLGKRLGKRENTGDLRPLLCVKLKSEGIRIVYALFHTTDKNTKKVIKSFMIVVISKREDMAVYLEALKRKPDLLAKWPEDW